MLLAGCFQFPVSPHYRTGESCLVVNSLDYFFPYKICLGLFWVFLLFRVLDFLVLVVWCFGFFVWFFFVWGFFCLVSWFWFFLLLPQTFIPSSQRIPRKGDRFWFFMAVPMTCFSFSGSCTQVWLHPQCWFGQIHLAGEVGGCQERNSSFFLLLMHLCYLSDSYVKGD